MRVYVCCVLGCDAENKSHLADSRLEALVDTTRGHNWLFSFLLRRTEGRALRALGPPTEALDCQSTVLTVSGLVGQVVDPPRWSDEV